MSADGLAARADADAYAARQPDYHRSLIAPADDMWASLADRARAHALVVDGATVGFAAINDAAEILAFHVDARFDDRSAALFDHLVERSGVVAAYPSTVDPAFLERCIAAARGPGDTRAILYHALADPEGEPLTGLRRASPEDHGAVVSFSKTALDAPVSFLDPYYRERIENGEVLLHEDGGALVALGECRADRRRHGHAHLGILVDAEHRGRGLGSRLMHALVLAARRHKLEPLCSTEPGNLAARRAIVRAGFRPRHRVFRVPLVA